MEERQMPPADASAKSPDAAEPQGKLRDATKAGLNVTSDDKGESMEPEAKPVSPSRRKKIALSKKSAGADGKNKKTGRSSKILEGANESSHS